MFVVTNNIQHPIIPFQVLEAQPPRILELQIYSDSIKVLDDDVEVLRPPPRSLRSADLTQTLEN